MKFDTKNSQSDVVLKVIPVALILGALAFAVVVIVIAGGIHFDNPPGVLSIVAFAAALVTIPTALWIRSFLLSKIDPAAPPQQYESARATALITPLAIAEGAAFFNLVIFLIERNVVPLVGAGLMLGVMAVVGYMANTKPVAKHAR